MTPPMSERKALELVVYPHVKRTLDNRTVTDHPDYFELPDGFCSHYSELPQKRFTDAELAAEEFRLVAWLGALWRTVAANDRRILIAPSWTFGPITRDEHEWQVMNRFATHAHHDEDNDDEGLT